VSPDDSRDSRRWSKTLARVAYVNGAFVPVEEARISIMDRGFLFGDGIYEVSAVVDGHMVDNEAHLARLARSLAAIRIEMPMDTAEWISAQEKLIALNGLAEGLVYLEVTRGVAERDFTFPKAASPTVVMFTQAKSVLANPLAKSGVSVITMPDLRWKRRDIKSVALLAQVLAKQEAAEAGAYEAWMVEGGFVTEGGSSSAFIVTRAGAIVTRPLSTAILPGITRQSLMALCAASSLRFEERPFTVAEAQDAAEAFLTSASAFVLGVVTIDGKPVADGAPGPVTRRLRDIYLAMATGRKAA
jgi:D-alanine transaminase